MSSVWLSSSDLVHYHLEKEGACTADDCWHCLRGCCCKLLGHSARCMFYLLFLVVFLSLVAAATFGCMSHNFFLCCSFCGYPSSFCSAEHLLESTMDSRRSRLGLNSMQQCLCSKRNQHSPSNWRCWGSLQPDAVGGRVSYLSSWTGGNDLNRALLSDQRYYQKSAGLAGSGGNCDNHHLR